MYIRFSTILLKEETTPDVYNKPIDAAMDTLSQLAIALELGTFLVHHTFSIANLPPHADFTVPQPRAHGCVIQRQSLGATPHDY